MKRSSPESEDSTSWFSPPFSRGTCFDPAAPASQIWDLFKAVFSLLPLCASPLPGHHHTPHSLSPDPDDKPWPLCIPLGIHSPVPCPPVHLSTHTPAHLTVCCPYKPQHTPASVTHRSKPLSTYYGLDTECLILRITILRLRPLVPPFYR